MVSIPPPPTDSGGGDGQASEEQALFANRLGAPSLVVARTDYVHDIIRVKRAFLRGLRHVSYLLPWVVFAMFMIWLDHIVGLQTMRWLTPDEVSHLQTLLFSGAVSALGTAIAAKTI
jgi:hypothetical protein